MLRKSITVAARDIRRHKGYSLISVAGLTVGFASCILIMLWVVDELSYDRFHEQVDRLYRVVMDIDRPQEQYPVSVTPVPMKSALREFEEIESVCRYKPSGLGMVLVGSETFRGVKVAYAEADFLEMFNFPMLVGNPVSALADVSSAVITEQMSKTWFGEENPIGRTLRINRRDFVVKGVVADLPHNSHISFDCLIPLATQGSWIGRQSNWGQCGLFTYVRLAADARSENVEQQIAGLRERHLPGSHSVLSLQPITRIHLFQDYPDFLEGHGDINYVLVFSAMAVFLVLIAIVNYLNLSTARGATRAREVSLRRISGATRASLMGRFIGESTLLAFLSLLLAIAVAEALLPILSEWTAKPLSFADTSGGITILTVVGLALVTGIAAGTYPAFVLSGFDTVAVLTGRFSLGKAGVTMRKALIAVQFMVAVFAIVGTVTIMKQRVYVDQIDLGYEPHNLLYVRLNGPVRARFDEIRTELLRHKDIVAVSGGSMPIDALVSTTRWDWEGKDPDDEVRVHPVWVDHQYLETMALELVAGRNFTSSSSLKIETPYIVNEAAVRTMGYDDPIGKRLNYDGHYSSGRPGRIVGVVKDFHYGSLHSRIGPAVLMVNRSAMRYLCLRISGGGDSGAIDRLRTVWREMAFEEPPDYLYLEDTLAGFYSSEKHLGFIFAAFGSIAVFISCLGLFGLTCHTVERRKKEIAIRKTIGASVIALLCLIYREFITMVLLGGAIGSATAFYAMNQWLENFAYRIILSWDVLLAPGLAAAVAAVAAVGFLVVRAARANPVEALKYE